MYTESEALDLLRAMATQSVPNCVNLDAIDRILAQTTRAEAHETTRFSNDLDKRLPDAFTNAVGILEHKGYDEVAQRLEKVAKSWMKELKGLRQQSQAAEAHKERVRKDWLGQG